MPRTLKKAGVPKLPSKRELAERQAAWKKELKLICAESERVERQSKIRARTVYCG
jgi:hypothetical protein